MRIALGDHGWEVWEDGKLVQTIEDDRDFLLLVLDTLEPTQWVSIQAQDLRALCGAVIGQATNLAAILSKPTERSN